MIRVENIGATGLKITIDEEFDREGYLKIIF